MPVEVLLKATFVLLVLLAVFTPLVTWIERKQSAIMQDRIGANRADIGGIRAIGLFHPIADVIKLMMKEDVVPQGANRVMHMAAPIITAVPALIAFAVIPFGGVYAFGGEPLSLVVADPDWGLLYVFAIGSIAAYGTIIAGWSSNSNWSLLGSLRASAQMISYEVTLGLSVVGIVLVFQTLSLQEMAVAQDETIRLLGFLELLFGLELPAFAERFPFTLPAWGIVVQPLGFLMFFAAILAENRRAPFDLPEGESEIVAGYHTEYSGMRFGLFYTAEFVEVVVIAGLVTTLFLGGWAVPWLSQETIVAGVSSLFGEGFATGICLVLHVVTFLVKVVAMIWLQMLVRWSLPRFRYDQVMALCWKILLPLSLANIFATAGALLWLRSVS